MSSQPYTQINDKENPSSSASKGDKKDKLLYIIIVSVLVFTLEIFVREPFTNLSEYIQERLNFEGKCWLGDVFVYFKYQGKAVIFLLIFNISNIYVSLSMITLDAFGIFINGTLKLIYTDPRPFWTNDKLVPCTCATNYGSPSTTGLDIYLVCIVVYRGLINRSSKRWWKILIWGFFLVPQALAWTSRFIQNIHSLHQLTFGLLCGYIIQYIYFEVLEVDMENSEQLRKFINNTSLIITIGLTCLSWVFFNALHYYFITVSESKHMIKHIGLYCDTRIEYFMFDNESYCKTAQAFLFIGSLVGIMMEYRFIFNSDFDKFASYNMGQNRWTETDEYKTTLRIITMYLLGKLLLHIPKWGSKKHDSVAYLNFSKNICANFFKGFFYFFIIKSAFNFLTLTNENKAQVREEDEPLISRKSNENKV